MKIGIKTNFSLKFKSLTEFIFELVTSPKTTFLYIQSRYTAAKNTPVAANTVNHQLLSTVDLKVPVKIRNSPTKPFSPGNPIEESELKSKANEKNGTTLAMPP